LAEQTDIIIGPLFSADVAATRAMAFARGVPMVALSNDQTQADDNTFLMGAWPGDQIQRVLAYAAENGTTRVLALLPDNAYGKSLIDVLQAGSAAPVIGIITYPAALTDPSMVLSEVKAREGQFDAILLPDGGTRAPLIATALRDAGVLTNARLLGSSLWDDVANPAALAGGWYATTDKAAQQSFAARYRQAFGEAPPALASLAYDATALAAVIAAQSWGYDASSLMHSQGFSGMAGLFRLKAGGQVQRALAIMEIAPDGQKIVDPAPSRF
jgi:ABC-type branched-subunit amino acid transport system substrate-binding protein